MNTIKIRVLQTAINTWAVCGVHKKDGGNDYQQVLYNNEAEALKKVERLVNLIRADDVRRYELIK
jgi:hypothetical protein